MWSDRLDFRCDRLRRALDRMSRARLLRFLAFWHAARPGDRFRRDGAPIADDDMPTWVLAEHAYCVVSHRWMVRRLDGYNRAWLIEHNPMEARRQGLIKPPSRPWFRRGMTDRFPQAAE